MLIDTTGVLAVVHDGPVSRLYESRPVGRPHALLLVDVLLEFCDAGVLLPLTCRM